MFKVYLGEIANASEIFEKLSKQILPVKVSYNLAKLINKLNDELKVCDTERIKLCEKYGKLNKKTNSYDIADRVNFDREINELFKQEVEISAEKIELVDEMKLTASDIILIKPFIKE